MQQHLSSPSPGANHGNTSVQWHSFNPELPETLVKQFLPWIFTFFFLLWEWILPGLKVSQWLPTQTPMKSAGIWFCTNKYPPTSCNVKAKFCSLQNTILNAFCFNFQLVYPPVFPHLTAIRWFNKNANNPHQNKSRWKGVLVKMFSSLNSGNHIYSNSHLIKYKKSIEAMRRNHLQLSFPSAFNNCIQCLLKYHAFLEMCKGTEAWCSMLGIFCWL